MPDPPQQSSALDRHPAAVLMVGAMLISWAPILVKALISTGLGPTGVAFWRCVLGVAVLWTAARVRATSLRLPRRVVGLTALAGLCFAIDLSVWHRSIVLVGAGMATILGNTQVFVTALLSWWFFGERPSARFSLSAVGAMGGIVLLAGVGSDVTFSRDYLVGIGYGLATGVVYGFFLICLRGAGQTARPGSTLARIAWISLFAALALAPLLPFETAGRVPSGAGAWGLALLLAVVAQSLGWWAISRVVPIVRGAVAGLILLLQPVLATVYGWLLFGERLEPLQIAGAGLTLAAIYLGSPGSRRGVGNRDQTRS